MNGPAYFLDTNVLVSAFLRKNSDARRFLILAKDRKIKLVTSEYVLKELRFALVRKIRVPRNFVESFILDDLAPSILILKKPSREEVQTFPRKIKDRSDIPIILPVIKHRLVLVTLDSNLSRSAKGYEVRSAREALEELSQERNISPTKSRNQL
jgi:predicted nucleic acid-binding protein